MQELPTVLHGIMFPPTVQMKAFCSTGMHLIFSNGVTVSVIWGPGSWTDNRDVLLDAPLSSAEDFLDFWNAPRDAETAEVAMWRADGAWIMHEYSGNPNDDGQPLGYQTTSDVQAIIAWAADYAPKGDE